MTGAGGPSGGRRGRGRLVALLPYLWLLAFFLVPFAIVLKLSFAEVVLAQPPFTPLFERLGEGLLDWRLNITAENYLLLWQDDLYIRAYLNSLRIAAIATAITLALGFPLAYAMSRAPAGWQGPLLLAVILPFWTSFLIRVYAWIGILRTEGFLNQALLWLGVPGAPLTLMNTEAAVLIGMVYSYLPFMVLPLYATLARQDPALLEAAADLGSPPFASFWTVTVPMAVPGIVAGSLLVFIPAVGEFVIPDLLGGSDTLMIGRTLWVEFFSNRDWPLASAVAVLLLLVLMVPIIWLQRQQAAAAARAAR